MVSMIILLFEISQLYSSGYRQMIMKDRISKRNNCKSAAYTHYSRVITDVLKRKFLICDVAGGQFGKPPFCSKGNPISKAFIMVTILLNSYRMH